MASAIGIIVSVAVTAALVGIYYAFGLVPWLLVCAVSLAWCYWSYKDLTNG